MIKKKDKNYIVLWLEKKKKKLFWKIPMVKLKMKIFFKGCIGICGDLLCFQLYCS